MTMTEAQTNLPEYSVSELSGAVKRAIEDGFSYVRVRGELGRISRPGSGHIYLDLKDDRAVLAAVIWKGVAAGLAIQPEQGLEVIATGRLTTFPGQSKYQMVIESLAPAGVGALMALLEERRKKLAAEGLFDEARKKPIPFLPGHIGVVTSPSGAVIRDILHRLNDRFPRHVTVWPVRVQGETSAREVASAISGFNAMEGEARPDLIIVARGGGSLEDLWGFNEEIVARAAAESAIPLISAVGHETDWTLIDHVADWRAPTPTAAAEKAVPVRLELLHHVSGLDQRLATCALRAVSERRDKLQALARGLPRSDDLFALPNQRLDTISGRLDACFTASINRAHIGLAHVGGRLKPGLLAVVIERGGTRLAELGRRLKAGFQAERAAKAARLGAIAFSPALISARVREARSRIDAVGVRSELACKVGLREQRARLDSQFKLLSSLGYRNVLERGYAVVTRGEGQPVTRAAALHEGDGVSLVFFDGERLATISDNAPRSDPQPRTGARAARPAARPVKQTDLFE